MLCWAWSLTPPGTSCPCQRQRAVMATVTVTFPTPEELYVQYGGEEDGIDREEFGQMLFNIDACGLSELDAKSSAKIEEFIDSEFERADLNHDGVIDSDEFMLYYFHEICFKFPVGKNGYNPGATLYNIFCNYCSYGKGARLCEEMESHQLLKLCRECGLLDRTFCRKADIDLVFHRARAETIYAKEKGARKLQYRQFLHALMLISEKRQTGFQEVVNRIRRNGDRHREASMADFIVSHDPCGNAPDCKELRRPAGLPPLQQGIPLQSDVSMNARAGALPPSGLVTMHPSAAKGIGHVEAAPLGDQNRGAAPPVRSQWGAVTTSEPAVIMEEAERPRWEDNAQEPEMIAPHDGGTGFIEGGTELPQTHAMCREKTVWHFQKMARAFYDDTANKRVTEVIQNPSKATLLRIESGCPHVDRSRKVDRSSVLHDSEAMHTVRTAEEEALTMALKYVFEQYNRWEGGVTSSRMDKMRFHKVFRDIRLLGTGDLDSQRLDAVFFKIKPAAQKAVNFIQFMEGLRHCAMITRMSLNDIVHRIVGLGGPIDIVSR